MRILVDLIGCCYDGAVEGLLCGWSVGNEGFNLGGGGAVVEFCTFFSRIVTVDGASG